MKGFLTSIINVLDDMQSENNDDKLQYIGGDITYPVYTVIEQIDVGWFQFKTIIVGLVWLDVRLIRW